jgi:hypothetical protein
LPFSAFSVSLLAVLSDSVHVNQSSLSFGIKPPTAPRPIFRVFHQSANHRVAVHVIQFFLHLSAAVHVEVIKSRLPECLGVQVVAKRKPSILSHFPRNTLLQKLQHRGHCPSLRFTDQQVDVIGHHHISHQVKNAFSPHSRQLFQETIPRVLAAQERQSPVAAEGQKMQIAFAVVTLQTCRHRSTPRPTLTNRGWGTLRLSFLRENVQRWYPPVALLCQQTLTNSIPGHPSDHSRIARQTAMKSVPCSYNYPFGNQGCFKRCRAKCYDQLDSNRASCGASLKRSKATCLGVFYACTIFTGVIFGNSGGK